MTRGFSRREKFFLLALAAGMLLGLYVLAVHAPVRAGLTALETERAALRTQLQLAQSRLERYGQMRRALAAAPRDRPPRRDSAPDLLAQLAPIFDGLDYELNFSEGTSRDEIAAREVRFTFAAPSYEAVRETVRQLIQTGRMDALTVASETDLRTGPQTVSGAITFFGCAP